MSELPDVAERLEAGPVVALLIGFGQANRAVATALKARGHDVVATDDHAGEAVVGAAAEIGVELVASPNEDALAGLVAGSDIVFPTPGLPEWHPAMSAPESAGVVVAGEFDLARAWDSRPLVAVTGTNGKTTVVELCVSALRASGIEAVAAGNTDLPLVRAIDDDHTELFVVEASSFRLGHAQRFEPRVAAWLNFAPDHLDVHRDLASYERAKAAIWAHLDTDALAVANRHDPIVMRNVPAGCRLRTFGRDDADWRVESDRLVGPDGDVIAVADLWRSMPHDVEDALAAAASASEVGATPAGLVEALSGFDMSAHRVELVGRIDGIDCYDDSKATTPHATVAALRSFESAVLIAGGRNKGVPLDEMLDAVDRVRAVVAIGEAAPEIEELFTGRRQVRTAGDMDAAVAAAVDLAGPGAVVLLSPGCASFDWYGSYGERGDDFSRAVRAMATRPAVRGER